MFRMLLVDDEPEIADSLKNMLKQQCCFELEIDTANLPREALCLASEKTYDLLMTDMRMPGMSGLEMAQKMMQHQGNHQMKVIFLTGYSDFDSLYRINKMQNAQYLLKNEEDCEIVSAIERAIKEIPAEIKMRRSLDDGENAVRMIEKCKEYIQQNLDKDLSLNSIAEYVNMNPSYFSRVFKSKTGENLSAYIHRIRVERAKAMISQSGRKISEIGESLGFESPAYFTTYFKKATGYTPQSYRNTSQLQKMRDQNK